MDMVPNQILRLPQLGHTAAALCSGAIWNCVSCQTCSSRCPKEVDCASIMDGLREVALLQNQVPPTARQMVAFQQAFLDVIRRNGRLYELELIARFKLGTTRQTGRLGTLVKDAGLAPHGNGYPTEAWKGRNLIFLGGGIAMPPIRCAIWYALENRANYGDITVVYGARTVGDLVYADELDAWAQHERVRIVRCVDPGGEAPDWTGEIGFVPTVFEKAKVASPDPVVLVIGPPIMIKNTLPVLDKMGVRPDSVYTSLANRMKCGIGKCDRCNVGSLYLCKEGPVLTMSQLQSLPLDH